MQENDEQSSCVQGVSKRKDVNVWVLVGLQREDKSGDLIQLHTLSGGSIMTSFYSSAEHWVPLSMFLITGHLE